MFLTQLFDQAPSPITRSLSLNKLRKRMKQEQNFFLKITPVNAIEHSEQISHRSNHDLEDVKGKNITLYSLEEEPSKTDENFNNSELKAPVKSATNADQKRNSKVESKIDSNLSMNNYTIWKMDGPEYYWWNKTLIKM